MYSYAGDGELGVDPAAIENSPTRETGTNRVVRPWQKSTARSSGSTFKSEPGASWTLSRVGREEP
ncbi:unnamed protein product [Clonostachys byssicola]|uniref:Uncharacterized protein n=1 Tax=Clonostachys byssicola TaxID=160290 RepID=A0A9N9UM40_9HYPO|nr:unnamed protein product [Clonostachys byssicola]